MKFNSVLSNASSFVVVLWLTNCLFVAASTAALAACTATATVAASSLREMCGANGNGGSTRLLRGVERRARLRWLCCGCGCRSVVVVVVQPTKHKAPWRHTNTNTNIHTHSDSDGDSTHTSTYEVKQSNNTNTNTPGSNTRRGQSRPRRVNGQRAAAVRENFFVVVVNVRQTNERTKAWRVDEQCVREQARVCVCVSKLLGYVYGERDCVCEWVRETSTGDCGREAKLMREYVVDKPRQGRAATATTRARVTRAMTKTRACPNPTMSCERLWTHTFR